MDLPDLWVRAVTVVDELGRRLAPLGWTLDQFEEDDFAGFVRPHDAGISFYLGVSLAPPDQELSLEPSVGVGHVEVARLSAEFLGVPAAGGMTGTTLDTLRRAATPAADGTERWTVYRPGDEAQEAAVAERVVEDLLRYGEPYLAERSSLPDIVARMSAGPRNQLDEAYLAIAYALLGDRAAAERSLAVVERPARPLLAGGSAERFVERFRRHFDLTGA